MDISAAIELLNTCVRSELRDHAFGDREVFWEKDDVEVAFGYFGSKQDEVVLSKNHAVFVDEEARMLGACGTTGIIERNDSTGPDAYSDGATMPGLTLEGVRRELTTDNTQGAT